MGWRRAGLAVVALAAALAWPGQDRLGPGEAAATQKQPSQREKRTQQKPKSDPETKPAGTAPTAPGPANELPPASNPAPVPVAVPAERVEADVSSRSVAIKLGFTGTEIIVFGSVDNSRQPSAESGYYDVVVALEGQSVPIIVRRKSNVAGLWMNTDSFAFDRVPSYYAIASTRPIEDIADNETLAASSIGFDHVRIRPNEGRVRTYSDEELKGYRDAIVRLKEKEKLYIRSDYHVTFIGRTLFRTTVGLPANIAVGPVEARVYLFRDGKLLSQYASRVMLERAGVELWLHGFANLYPLLYGLFTVAVAVSAGLLASAFFRNGAH